MTSLTYILGAVSLKVLRRKFGRAGYWGITTVMSMALYALGFKVLGIAFFTLILLIGVFAELEEMGIGLKTAAFFTIVINSLLGAGAFLFWVYSTGPKWSQLVLTYLEALFKPATQMNPQMQINYFTLMLMLPSVILTLWLGSLYVAILLESRLVNEGEKTADENQVPVLSMRRQLMELRMPDGVVWAFIVALLGAFGRFGHQGLEAFAVNVFNVCLVLFLFQGIACVARFFEKIRMSAFWQTLFMALVVIYLFPFVSFLGLTDHWFDYRARLAKRTEEFNRET